MSLTRKEAHDVVVRLVSPTREDPGKSYRDVHRHLQRTTPFIRQIFIPAPLPPKDMVVTSGGGALSSAGQRSRTPTTVCSDGLPSSRRERDPPAPKPPVVVPSAKKSVGIFIPSKQSKDHNDHRKGSGVGMMMMQSPAPVGNCFYEEEPCDYERVVRHTLQELNVVPKHDDNPLQDSLTNGTLLCELICVLEQSPVVRCHQQPNSVLQMRENYHLALECLHSLSNVVDHVPPGTIEYVRVQELLQGNFTTLWPLLYHVLRCYSNRLNSGTLRLSSTRTSTYSPANMSALEAAICQWLMTLPMSWPWSMSSNRKDGVVGPLNSPYVPPNSPMKQSSVTQLKHITCPNVFPYIQNGMLLAEITSAVLGQPVIGLTNNPRREGMCLKNIELVLRMWKAKDGMASLYICHPDAHKAIYAGDKVFVLLLLEDMMRYHQRVPPRRSQPTHTDKPFLGVPPARETNSYTPSYLPPRVPTNELTSSIKQSSLLHGNHATNPPSTPSSNNVSPQKRLPMSASTPTPIPPNRMIFESDETEGANHHEKRTQQQRVRSSSSHVDPSSHTHNRNQTTTQKPLITRQMETDVHVDDLTERDIDWILSVLRRPEWNRLDESGGLNFSDGCLLARLVESLERAKCPLSGIDFSPITTAAKKNNIRRVLEYLKVQKKLFAEYLFLEDHILENNTRAMATVVKGLRRAYRR